MLLRVISFAGRKRVVTGEDVHLRIKDANRRLHNGNSLIISLHLIYNTLLTAHHSHQIKPQILGVQIRSEAVRQALLLASRDLSVISCSSQVAYNQSGWVRAFGECRGAGERSTDDGDVHRCYFVIREID